ncbi:cytochrome P450 family 808F-CYP808F1 [Chondrus crispus]|uniref:Cytochrome P450 family 808F-CYP808F1 n=1 Tax=Chondrus crispus TaxID=2769 RepID=R7Q8B3_CHOCR|nr:cytochrome P450 family 808F-CYP808F1 [Chondrus crispus]CDF34023.1 cytochrome P450 family 808F-CYP808F1 [Chondrus crispus]|eukprot:XP_005713842.1 cytochrome P450 family 808F-CYP808F1 [Chondrus crispus]
MDVLNIQGSFKSFFHIVAVLLSLSLIFVLTRLRHMSAYPSLPGPSFLALPSNALIRTLLCNSCTFTDIMDQLSSSYGSFFGVWIGFSRVVVTSVPSDIVQISFNAKMFPRPARFRQVFNLVAPGCLFSMETEQHQICRKLLRDSFSHNMLRNLCSLMTHSISELCTLLDHYAACGTPVEISKLLAATSTSFVTNVALGADVAQDERLELVKAAKHLTKEMMIEYVLYPLRQALSRFGSRDKMYECRDRIREACQGILNQRMREPKSKKESRNPDVLDAFIDLQGHSRETTVSLIVEMVTAGSHTTYQILSACIYEICRSPRIINKIEKELTRELGDFSLRSPLSPKDVLKLSYLSKVWKEVCRLHPIATSDIRVAAKDILLKGSGILVPKGTEIHAQLRGCHLNKSVWKDAHAFKPERWGNSFEGTKGERVPAGAFVPYGLGQFSCMGRFFADYVGPLILAEMYRRHRFTLAPQTDCDRALCTCLKTRARPVRLEEGFSVLVFRRE